MPIALFTVSDVAEVCRVAEKTIRDDIALKYLKPSFQVSGAQGTRSLMTQADVDAYQAWRTKMPIALLTVSDVALVCQVFVGRIHGDIDKGRLKPSFIAGGEQRTRYLMTPADVEAYQAWRSAEYGDDYNAAYAVVKPR